MSVCFPAFAKALHLPAFPYSLFPDAHACFKRINEVLDTEVSIKDSEKDTPAKTAKGTVEFRRVTFAYPNADEPVIKDISFVSKPGETTAIIGRTGCRKSSIVKLIPRLYDTLFGDVFVDAHTEQTIQNAMATLMKGRTSFVIAHRLSTIRDANSILYMESGDIKEVGNHETLMALGGKYADLYNSQFA